VSKFIFRYRIARGPHAWWKTNTKQEGDFFMTKSFCLLTLTPLVFAGCASEPVVTTTSTEVRREVVQTQGDRVVAREVTVTRTPPAIRVETQTRSPGTQYVWTRGYWRWTGTAYVWVPGSWVMRPKPAAVWVESQWQRRPGGWVFVAGHWE
jgi:hypothetical protein